MKTDDFLGTGWGFPPTFDPIARTVETVSDEQDIYQSLQILLSTQLTERVMRSDFGCDLTPLLFENITVTLLTKIKGIIEHSILMYEPRIDLNDIYFASENNETQGVIRIQIEYTIRATNSRHNYVFPYYLEEGTYIKT
ncbi:phage baseplate assembly protein W [Chryseobacterium defluvii]|uniref:Phage baseplate assembly protein W n=1 Tax=Chryseobacterium defluvii TaxID=160396 RepID=A0A840KAG5_9FLAO|nr:GPW/gp25 family protein [Chryseobacterium defluvii]MBB4804814.1 phage baseplate assembly protein W [Chryseobacterium defluvii]